MTKNQDSIGVTSQPVQVVETIPVQGENELPAAEVADEGIPTPAHLLLFPELGRGGMGCVHPAIDRNLLRRVALKRLDKDLSGVPMYKDGFIAEAQITGQLEHPNIVPVHELGISDQGVPYFTMKLVNGVSFDTWLADPAHELGSSDRLREGLGIFLKVCDAVAYAHHRGVIHRDLKPDNIMVASFGQVYVMDWGIAKLTKARPASGARAHMEATGAVGTLPYMAPEQARGNPEEMDERSDVFGLGAILYKIISGKTPYGESTSIQQALARAVAGKVVPIDTATSGVGVSKRIRSIVQKAVAANPDERFQSVSELQDAVRGFLQGGLHLPRQAFARGSIIIREGEMGNAAYMIVSGSCRAFRATDGGQETLGTMKAGEVFGEMALLLDEPRSASVEAIDQVTVLVLDQSTMMTGLGFGGWTGALVRALAQRFRALERRERGPGSRS